MKSGLLKLLCLAMVLGICFWGKNVLEQSDAYAFIPTDENRLYEDARFYGVDFSPDKVNDESCMEKQSFDDSEFWGVPMFEKNTVKERKACF